jgi:hypothetical protein
VAIKPDLKFSIRRPIQTPARFWPLEVEGVTAVAPLRITLREVDAKCETVQLSPMTSAQAAPKWLKQQWQAYRATIFLATSTLVFVLALADWARPWQSSPEPRRTIFKELLSSLGLAAPPPVLVHHDEQNTRVWVDIHTGLYYCPGAQLYGKTQGGKFTTERHALLEHFTAANHKLCQ